MFSHSTTTSNDIENTKSIFRRYELYFNQIISYAIEEHWIRDIRETIWKQVMKEKDDILRI